MIEVKAPGKVPPKKRVFLAGSIEMGTAIEWQKMFVDAVSDLDIVCLNPRRDDWDHTWEQSITNPKFVEQVTWELDNLYGSDYVVFVFDPNAKSPITLMELGLMAGQHKTILVCCPPGFWRKGNVDVVCKRHCIPVFESMDAMIKDFRERVGFDNGEW